VKGIKGRSTTGVGNQDFDPHPPRQRSLVVWLQTLAFKSALRRISSV
jgi:hypothetical protein